jgi:hypothetical protein
MRRLMVAVALLVGGTLAGCGPLPPTEPEPDPDLAECQTERETIELALEAYLISEPGMSYPPTLEQLLGTYLKPGTITQPWEYGSVGATYTLDGPC